MPDVAIVIVHYNADLETKACLRSLQALKTDEASFSVILVDNGSKIPFELSEKHQPAKTTLLRSDKNLGFTSGNNLGIRHALAEKNPDYILLLNNDTIIDPNCLNELVRCAQTTPQVGMVTPLIYFAAGREYHADSYSSEQQGKVIWYAGASIDWPNLDAFHRGVDEIDRGHFNTVQQTDFATGCCALIPRQVLETVGMFDPRYFLYLEDVDLSVRIRKAGYRLELCPAAKVWHENAGSTGGSGSELQQYYQTRNRLLFFTKHLPPMRPTNLVMQIWKVFRHYSLVSRFGLQLLLKGNAIERRAAWDWATLRFGKQAIL